MRKTMVAIVVLVVSAGACKSKPTPPPVTPVVEAPVTPPVELKLDGAPWTVAAAGAVVTTSGQYDLTVTTPGFTLTIQPWPDSEVFVRTSGEHLQSLRERDPALEVLHEVDGGPGAFQVVARTRGQIDGTVLVPGPADDAMCGFELAADADWRPALDACLSLQPQDDGDRGVPELEGAGE